MRYFLLITLGLLISCLSCKTMHTRKKKDTSQEQPASLGKTIGKVSHEYKNQGCNTVILVETEGQTLVLIPAEPLPAEFDKNGTTLRFDYHPLKMMQSEGCPKGIPAELVNISKNN